MKLGWITHLLLFVLFIFSLNQYMGFGPSASQTQTIMFGADPVITWVDETNGPQAVDYHLSSYVQV